MCTQYKALHSKSIMSYLPASCTQNHHVLSQFRMDYGGPYLAKVFKRRITKTGVLLICIKVIHVKIISDLTTNAFFTVVDNFVAHRGIPTWWFVLKLYYQLCGGCSSVKKTCSMTKAFWIARGCHVGCTLCYKSPHAVPHFKEVFGKSQ